MVDLIFLIIPLLIGGVAAKINSKSIMNNIYPMRRWINAQLKLFNTKTGFAYRLILLQIFKGTENVFIQIDKIKNSEIQAGVYVASLIYATLLLTLLLGVAVFYFIYAIGIILLAVAVLWLLDKRNFFNRVSETEYKKIKTSSSTEVIDLNKEEDLLQTEKPKSTDLDQFGLPKK